MNTIKSLFGLRWLALLDMARGMLLIMILSVANVRADALYSIGNSLTNDMYPDGIQVLSQAMNSNLSVGYHIRSSASLTYMVANPLDVTLIRPAPWMDALANYKYDYIALQPYRGLGEPTVGTETAAVVQIVESALGGPSRQAVFYLYEAWPSQDDTHGNYHEYWTQSIPADSNLPPLQARQYYDRLLAELRGRFGNRATFRVIPVGDVFDRIDQDARAGLIPGVADMRSLYRDQIHMGEVGRFVAAATVLTTIYQRRADVDGALDMFQFNDGEAALSRELAQQLEDLVWRFVATDPRTGAVAQESPAPSMEHSDSGTGAIEWWWLLCGAALLALRYSGNLLRNVGGRRI